MKRLLLSLLLLLPLMAVAESEVPTALVVWMTDGTQTTFLLSQTPCVTVGPAEITVTTTDGSKATLSRAEVHKYTLGKGKSDGVAEPQAATLKPHALVMGDVVKISGMQAGTAASVYTLDGRTVAIARADEGGIVEFSLSQQGAGIYLIKAQSSTIKILKK